jgi:glutamine cyclotransferase
VQIYNLFVFLQTIARYKIQLYIGFIILKTMKKHNLLGFILLSAVIVSCGDDKKDENNSFSIDTTNLKQTYTTAENLPLLVTNAEKEEIDSVIYYINDVKAGTATGNKQLDFALKGQKFGYLNIRAVVYYDGETAETTSRIEVVSDIAPKLLKYDIVNTYPHDIKAYTQGLEFYRDTLIEGTGSGAGNTTGIKEISNLRKVNYKTGEIYKKVSLGEQYFGEGVTVLNNKIYQLTYKNNTGFVYNADTMEKESEFKYFKETEGWGLTNDGTNLYMTDGSEKIYVLDPKTLKEKDYVNVYTQGTKVKAVNELEWVNGKIYGNIYQMDAIAIINPKTGAVEGVVNLADLKNKITRHPDLDVLNGIAYNPKTKTFFVTGKNWDKMFEIQIKE